MFASRLEAGRLSLIASWPQPSTLFVAVGDGPYLVRTDDPDDWSRLDRPTCATSTRRPTSACACCSTTTGCRPTTPTGLAWESEHLGPDAAWLGRLDDEVHLRAGDVLHRVLAAARQHDHRARVLVSARLERMRWWHVAALMPVERALFAPEPWTRAAVLVRARPARHPPLPRGARRASEVVGYAGLCDYPDEAFVQTIAVAPAAQGTGPGRPAAGRAARGGGPAPASAR